MQRFLYLKKDYFLRAEQALRLWKLIDWYDFLPKAVYVKHFQFRNFHTELSSIHLSESIEILLG